MEKKDINTIIIFAVTLPIFIILIDLIINGPKFSLSLFSFPIIFGLLAGALIGFILVKMEQKKILETLSQTKKRVLSARELYIIFISGLAFSSLSGVFFEQDIITGVFGIGMFIGWLVGYQIIKIFRRGGRDE